MDFNQEEAEAALGFAAQSEAESDQPMVLKPSVFPKFQWSVFAGDTKNEQFVVRENDFSQFKIAVKAIKANLSLNAAVVQPAAQVFVPDNLNSTCAYHNVAMTQAISKSKGTPYWSHKGPNGEICFGKGYLPPKQ